MSKRGARNRNVKSRRPEQASEPPDSGAAGSPGPGRRPATPSQSGSPRDRRPQSGSESAQQPEHGGRGSQDQPGKFLRQSSAQGRFEQPQEGSRSPAGSAARPRPRPRPGAESREAPESSAGPIQIRDPAVPGI